MKKRYIKLKTIFQSIVFKANFLLIALRLHLIPFSSQALAQSLHSNTVDSIDQKIVRFQQDFNSYQWQFLVQKHWQIHPAWLLSIRHDFTSSLLNQGRMGKKWKDNQVLDLGVRYFIQPKLALKSNFSSLYFIDHQTGLINDLNIAAATTGLEYSSLIKKSPANFFFSPQIGIKSDQRFDLTDRGLTSALDLRITDYEFAEYFNSLSLKFQSDLLGVRKQQNVYFFHQIYKQFYEETSDTLRVLIDQKQRDYYLSTAGEIERLKEKNNIISNKLNYLVTEGINLSLINEIRNRNVDVSQFQSESTATAESRQRTDFRFDNQLFFRMKRDKMNGIFEIKYWTQEQLYESPAAAKNLPFSRRIAFIAPDNKSHLFGISSQLGWNFLKSDSLAIGTSISRLQYDTPDSSNFDDRDEFRFDLKITEVHTFSPVLRLQIDAMVNLYHLVYIFGERSADNNWNRIFRLEPKIHLNLLNQIYLYQFFEVMANYVDYDYEVNPEEIRSFVYRKFAAETALKWPYRRQNFVNFSYRIELEENGTLFWDKWSERPLLTRQNVWFRANFSFLLGDFLIIAPGLNYYARDEWKFSFSRDGLRQFKEKFHNFVSFGPLLNVLYQPREKLKFIASLTRNKIAGNNQKKYYINNINLELRYNF